MALTIFLPSLSFEVCNNEYDVMSPTGPTVPRVNTCILCTSHNGIDMPACSGGAHTPGSPVVDTNDSLFGLHATKVSRRCPCGICCLCIGVIGLDKN